MSPLAPSVQVSTAIAQHVKASVVVRILGRAVWGPQSVFSRSSCSPPLLCALPAMLLVIFKGEGRESIRKLDWYSERL